MPRKQAATWRKTDMWGTACADVEVHGAAGPTSPTSEKQPPSLTRSHTGGHPFSFHVESLMYPTFSPVHEWHTLPGFQPPFLSSTGIRSYNSCRDVPSKQQQEAFRMETSCFLSVKWAADLCRSDWDKYEPPLADPLIKHFLQNARSLQGACDSPRMCEFNLLTSSCRSHKPRETLPRAADLPPL